MPCLEHHTRGSTGIVLMGLATAPAIAGEQRSPNIGDEFLGKANGLRYASDSNAFNPLNNDFASVDVGCGPSAWHQLGGGAGTFGQTSATYVDSARGVDFGDGNDDGDDGVYASGHGPKGGTVTAYSICRKGAGLKPGHKEIPDGSGAERTGTIRCTGANRRVSSGSAFISTSESPANSSYPTDGPDKGRVPDDGWRGRVVGFGGRTRRLQHVQRLHPRATHVRASEAQTVPGGKTRAKAAGCANSQQVVGGGVKVSGAIAQARLLESVPIDDGDPGALPDDGWRGAVFNDTGAAKKLSVTPSAGAKGSRASSSSGRRGSGPLHPSGAGILRTCVPVDLADVTRS